MAANAGIIVPGPPSVIHFRQNSRSRGLRGTLRSGIIDARGWARTQEIVVEKGSWQVVSLMALR